MTIYKFALCEDQDWIGRGSKQIAGTHAGSGNPPFSHCQPVAMLCLGGRS